jgi:hypothetical protein
LSSLRRTALARKTLLRRSPMPRRASALAARAVKTIDQQKQRPRPADTGPSTVQRRAVAERAGYRCELCTQVLGWPDGTTIAWTTPHSFHHRRPRGMGGTCRIESNEPPNLLLVCGTGTTGCHARIEANRDLAYDLGWLVHQQQDPALVPVNIATEPTRTTPRLLTPDGRYEEAS